MVKHVIISGRVQGVGFRYFIKKNADAQNVNGWVRNKDDGTVEAVLDGNDEDVQKMLNLCEKGPISSYVKEVKELNAPLPEKDYRKFEVRS